MNLQKNKPWRNKKYLAWVRGLPCVVTGRTDRNVAHHIISCGMGGTMGGKPSDLFVIPLDADVHSLFHSCRKSVYIDQKAEVLKIIEKAINEGLLVMGDYSESN